MVTVFGQRLLNVDRRGQPHANHLRCHFMIDGGSAEDIDASPATVVSPQAVRCRLPPLSAPGVVQINLRFANLLNKAATVPFIAYSSAPPADNHSQASQNSFMIESIHPRGGPSSGGTTITLVGTGLMDDGGRDENGDLVHGLYCRFDLRAAE